MEYAITILAIVGVLAAFIFTAIKSWNRGGEPEATKPDKVTAADPYAGVEAVGRSETELERDNDPVRSLEDADGGGYTPEEFGAAAAGDGLI